MSFLTVCITVNKVGEHCAGCCMHRWAGKQNRRWNTTTASPWAHWHVVAWLVVRWQQCQFYAAVIQHPVTSVTVVAADADTSCIITLARHTTAVSPWSAAVRRTPVERTRGPSTRRVQQDIEREVDRLVMIRYFCAICVSNNVVIISPSRKLHFH